MKIKSYKQSASSSAASSDNPPAYSTISTAESTKVSTVKSTQPSRAESPSRSRLGRVLSRFSLHPDASPTAPGPKVPPKNKAVRSEATTKQNRKSATKSKPAANTKVNVEGGSENTNNRAIEQCARCRRLFFHPILASDAEDLRKCGRYHPHPLRPLWRARSNRCRKELDLRYPPNIPMIRECCLLGKPDDAAGESENPLFQGCVVSDKMHVAVPTGSKVRLYWERRAIGQDRRA
ncbi:hypothetical protein QBC34DRAFT_417787 [Podospora aff. communis PSN243]|uniref:Uncharacterized protein n=1 Tax=Podospora aff. communis PSN243 TaxID=3040156 RepID=A0AAV9G3D0_9PEZI|nr:hypothetical protein QBC34DRAFT_417787 [Podospora aff. communis PSN243]